MTDSSATLTRNVAYNFPDYPDATIKAILLTHFAAEGNEGFPEKEYAKTLTAGTAVHALPVPSVGAWLYQFVLPDGNQPLATLSAGPDIQLTAVLAAALSTETPNSLLATFILKTGDTMTGPLTFSGTDHAGVVVISLTTAQRDALTPAVGMIIHNSTTAQFEKYDGAWGALGGGAVDSVFGRTGAVVAAVSDYNAGQVAVTPAGGITSDNAQAALVELDSDIQSVAGSIVTNFNELFDTPASISANTLMWGGPLGGALVEKTAGDSLTSLGGQPANSKLSALAALTWAANSIVQLTGAATAVVVTLAAHVWTFLQSANAADARAAIGAGTGDVTAAAVIADNAIVRGDGGAKGVQSSGVTIDDSNNLVSPGTLGVDVDGNGINDITIGRYTTLNNRGRITATDYLYLTVGTIDILTAVSNEAIFAVTVRPQGVRALGLATNRWNGTYSTVFDGYSNGGGFKTWAAAAVVGTPQTVIANGTGDVTLVLSGTFTVSDGAGNVAGGVITATAPSGTFNLYDDGGTNTCQLQVAADGSVVVVRTAGARTYAVNLCLNWL